MTTTFTIASGRYRLYLLTDDDQPATVTVRFGQLEGEIRLEPAAAADYTLSQPGARLAGGAGVTTNVYGAGQSGTIDDTGMLFQAVSMDTTVSAGGQYVFCYRPPGGGDIDPIEPVETGPGCWALSPEHPIANNREVHVSPDSKLYLHAVNRVPSGPQDFGYWGATQAVVEDLTYLQFWLEFDDL